MSEAVGGSEWQEGSIRCLLRDYLKWRGCLCSDKNKWSQEARTAASTLFARVAGYFEALGIKPKFLGRNFPGIPPSVFDVRNWGEGIVVSIYVPCIQFTECGEILNEYKKLLLRNDCIRFIRFYVYGYCYRSRLTDRDQHNGVDINEAVGRFGRIETGSESNAIGHIDVFISDTSAIDAIDVLS